MASFWRSFSKKLTGNLKETVEVSKMGEKPINLDDFSLVKEGEATILYPKEDKVFYNPIQQFNRDLSVTGIRAWSELRSEESLKVKLAKDLKKGKKRDADGNVIEVKSDQLPPEGSETPAEVQPESAPWIKILEALSASGLRAIRYGKEIPHVKQIVANDFSPNAVESIKQNITYNNVQDKVVANEGDAIVYMAQQQSNFHVIDLDPYGTAAPFMDSALQAIKDDGLLLVTCTDLGVLAGNGYPEKCFALYGGTNLWGDATHESALRVVLHMIATTAAKYKKTIEPQLCLSIDFYVRLFIKVKTSPIKVKELLSNTMVTYSCSGCGATSNQFLGRKIINPKGSTVQNRYNFKTAQGPPCGPTCSFCGNIHHITGPMWGAELHNETFLNKILSILPTLDKNVYGTIPRIKGMVTLAKNELQVPFYFKPSTISSVLRITSPPINEVVAALGNAGFEASLTHASASAIKTNASWEMIWHIFKQWMVRENLKPSKKLSETSIGWKILHNDKIGTDFTQEIKFDENELSKKVRKLRNDKILRFQQNPEKNWGPKSRPESK